MKRALEEAGPSTSITPSGRVAKAPRARQSTGKTLSTRHRFFRPSPAATPKVQQQPVLALLDMGPEQSDF